MWLSYTYELWRSFWLQNLHDSIDICLVPLMSNSTSRACHNTEHSALWPQAESQHSKWLRSRVKEMESSQTHQLNCSSRLPTNEVLLSPELCLGGIKGISITLLKHYWPKLASFHMLGTHTLHRHKYLNKGSKDIVGRSSNRKICRNSYIDIFIFSV